MFGKSVLAVSCLTVAAGVWVTSASAKMTLRVAYSSISGSAVVPWIAIDKGLFAKYDLDVELIYVAGSQATRIADQVPERLPEVVAHRRTRHPADGLDPALLDQALDGRGHRLVGQAGRRRPVLGRQGRLEVNVLQEEVGQARHW